MNAVLRIFAMSIIISKILVLLIFFFNDTATTEIYTLSLHDALPISSPVPAPLRGPSRAAGTARRKRPGPPRQNRPAAPRSRSEEHTSELQSRLHLVCRLLLEKKKNKNKKYTDTCAVLIVASIDNRPD